MKIFKTVCYLFAAVMLCSCSGGSMGSNSPAAKAIEKDFAEDATYYVLQVAVGDIVEVSNKPSGSHPTGLPTSGMRFTNNITITNHMFGYHIIGCLGCDECMSALAKAGFINYSVKQEMGDSKIASVSLTGKGEKYRVENMLDTTDLKDHEGVELLVLSYDAVENIEVISEYADGMYVCRSNIVTKTTPVLDAFGYDKSQTDPKALSREQLWNVLNIEKGKVDKISNVEYIFDRGNDFSYDLSKYTKEEALADHLDLSDSLATVTCHYFGWDGLYLGREFGKITRHGDLPEVAKKALLQHDDREYYFLNGVRKLNKVLKDTKMKKDPLADDWRNWNLNELHYTVDINYTEFAAITYECPRKATLYGKIPYIVIDNILYFIPEELTGVWAHTRSAMENHVYGTRSESGDVFDPHWCEYQIPLSSVAPFLE